MTEPRHPRKVLVASAGLALLLLAGWMWLVSADAGAALPGAKGPPGAIGQADDPAQSTLVVAADAETNTDGSPAAAADQGELRTGTQGRIFGELRFAEGGAVAGVMVRLHRIPDQEDEKPQLPSLPLLGVRASRDPFAVLQSRQRRSWDCITDQAGRFEFTDLLAGEYSLTADLGIFARERIQLATGEQREVSLVFAAAGAWLTGRVHGEVAPSQLRMWTTGSSAQHSRQIPIDSNGRFRHLLPPGNYTLHLGLLMGSGLQTIDFASMQVLAKVGGALHWEPHVQCGSLTVTLADPALLRHGALAAVLQADGPTRPAVGSVRAQLFNPMESRQFDAAGKVTFPGLAPGRYQLSLRGAWLVESPPREVQLTLAALHQTVELAPAACGIVRLQVQDESGLQLRLADAPIALITAAGKVQGGDLRLARSGRAVGEQYGWGSVALGPAELRFADERRDGEHVLLPFDPPAGGSLACEVQPGDENLVVLRAARRAQVRLVAVDEVGREVPSSQIQVFLGSDPVRSQAARKTRWEGCLPPGDYRVVIERSSGRREQGLAVGRQDIDLRLRP